MEREEFDKIVDEFTCRGEFELEWCIGGQEGGSCWNDGGDDESRHYPVSADPEPEFSDLDSALLEIVPNLSFLMYKKLMSKVDVSERTSNDYYDNYTRYAVKKIAADELWLFLVEHNLV